MAGITRRSFMSLSGVTVALPWAAHASAPIRLGLTPVFLDNDGEVISTLQRALERGTGRPIELMQRRTYQEVTGLLLEGGVDAAWLCGFSYLQHEAALGLLGAPVWRGAPLYRSYLITASDDAAQSLADLRGGTHAFSDPDSNSGWLVTVSDLVRLGERSETFFERTLFTFGHRNVVRAVAGGLTRSGSVDGYVWEALSKVDPDLTGRTKVISQSELLGFPPFVTRQGHLTSPEARLLKSALLGLASSSDGRAALDLLQLDRVVECEAGLFDGIRARMIVMDDA